MTEEKVLNGSRSQSDAKTASRSKTSTESQSQVDNQKIPAMLAATEPSPPDDTMDVDPVIPTHTDLDLLRSIKGMFRVLDLISETGSPTVDKIIIAQESVKELINEFSPGAYASLTKVDFKALDKLLVQPLGFYGSKSEIVTFLSSRGVFNEEIARALLRPADHATTPHLRSGLYAVRVSDVGPVASEQIFVIYWPEATTWNDDATSSVQRNRVTFMRYLTKISDQVACLISPEHARAIVWSDEPEDISMDLDEESDRLFTFEVAKTNEQDEDVTVRPGFTMNATILTPVESFHAECPLDASELLPTLIHGETAQAILTKRFVPSRFVERSITKEDFTALKLKSLLATGSIRFHPTLTDKDIEILMEHGLDSRYPVPFKAWKTRNNETKKSIEATGRQEEQETCRKVQSDAPMLEPVLQEAIIDQLLNLFPTVQRTVLSSSGKDLDSLRAQYESLVSVHVKLREDVEKIGTGKATSADLTRLLPAKFKPLKEQILCIEILFAEKPDLEEQDRKELIKDISENGTDGLIRALKSKEAKDDKGWLAGKVRSWFSQDGHADAEKRIRRKTAAISDAEFLASFDDMLAKEPLLQDIITQALEVAHDSLRGTLSKLVSSFTGKATLLQEQTLKSQIQRKTASILEEVLNGSRRQLIEEYERELPDSLRTLDIEKVVHLEKKWGNDPSFQITGSDKSRTEPLVECKLHTMHLTTDDQQTVQLNPTIVPSPHLQASTAHIFNLKLGHRIVHAQLLENKKLLLIIQDSELLYIFLESPSDLDRAIARGRNGAKRILHLDKIGKDVILAYDEQKRMLSLCAASKLSLHIYVFEETFTSLQAWGVSLDLKPWYAAGTVVSKSCFVGGCEEILFIDTSGQARIFSLITQQFRPASLSLDRPPDSLHSSPDGACLVLSFRDGDHVIYRAYHWSTFGSSQGIDLGALDLPDAPAKLTSLVTRRNVHLVGIDIDKRVCKSIVLDITKKTTEFMFKETGVKAVPKSGMIDTAHNCLIDVHADVWTRFPVVAAVQRQTISSIHRKARKLFFLTDRDHDRFTSHFSELIYAFEQRTRKPTGDNLKTIQVLALSSACLFTEESHWELSQFRAGEWLVDLLCLIPIQIALTHENRFLPLKDGVTSAELERSLLGAEVGQIVDALSFGWFESVFQSYMTSKASREQSVGKSYTLNHLADTSFAGSAMRTTEGVWMSVTPTNDALIVALDFEGVHSIERSAQEDTLLVLFNTAISNMVLFRNNFAMSRSITGLFQSFQSSSTVLDPAANPTLFRSTLTIIIKDVVESDKKEIVREFSTKFHQIVEDEQDANFISQLHAGQLNIIPWPVIESKQFYTLFPAIKRLLDKQEVTHRTAGEFLHTLKTLMAKLKANDWGSLSQNLIAHRAQKLLGGLNNALTFGFFEVEPDHEPLKNFDTDQLIDKPDTPSYFFLSDKELESSNSRRESILADLQSSWDEKDKRSHVPETEWTAGLSAYLDSLVDMRINHVYEWISSNLSRFKSSHAHVEMLRRVFDTAIVDLRANVEICGTQCANCQLKCLLSRRHDSTLSHDCRTSHQCLHPCDFGDEHPSTEKTCGLPCAVDIHLCGEPCALKNKPGCIGGCMKLAGHGDDGHMCSARLHKCGEPCGLKNMKVSGAKLDEVHTQHVCDATACPVSCELCKRLCCDTEHLHGLQSDAIHLCGQPHSCSALCQADGTCEIETAPQSIEATFTGRHETFQYTKLTVAKRRPCVYPIPAGKKAHSGPHNHSTDPAPFHYCETRCESCGYFCTLPRGHPQQEHETRHGSMSRTQWAIDGPDGTILELNGRKFGASDEGTPLLCSLMCQEMGRHVHVDYCRADDAASCNEAEVQHLKTRLTPHPRRAKDWISHSLFWRRSDPYSRPDQLNFSKCDAMCPDTEHAGNATNPPNPSYCALPLFHPPATQAAGLGYLSNDGHLFNCKNPAVLQNAFHVIFVIDRSSSMGGTDRRPLTNAPGTALISRWSNNRLGAVYSALHAFWMSRNTALTSGGQGTAGPVRRDAYSVVLFDHTVSVCIANDFSNTSDELLNKLLAYQTGGGTNFTLAITSAQTLMRTHWSSERTPVVIFLSDGECDIADETMRTLSRSAVALGKPLSFHSVSFGRASQSSVLRRMAQVALEVQTNAPRDPLLPAEATINSSYSEALDTVRLAETFLGFAESLRKPRGALFSSK
ncbi:hypothetical protein GGX14DRAFT_451174 [Mycena pura]|uniref:VWFA domain-containing protein n=1 Tax=Mycena pura TaxID=153505 RepID=A0AAD6YAR2_9AGAR|nr:hypothetical protein GGX14DRAFT_451174 [Mycena pura]